MAQNTPIQQLSVTLQGVDTSTPRNTVETGKCEVLHNLRYHDSAWRNVNPYQTLKSIPISDKYILDIVYKHPTSADDKYIAWIHETGASVVYLTEVSINDTIDDMWTDKKIILTASSSDYASINISHYGNVLIVQMPEEIEYYIYSNNAYQQFNYPQPPILVLSRNSSIPYPTGISLEIMAPYGESAGNWRSHKIYNINTGSYILPETGGEQDMWHGEIALFACYRMSNGTNIAQSAVGIIASEPSFNIESSTPADLMFAKVHDTNTNEDYVIAVSKPKTGTDRICLIKATVGVAIPDSIDNNIIDRVAIYATRINPIFRIPKENIVSYPDFNYNSTSPNGKAFSDEYAENDLFNQPFYLVEEKRVSEIDGTWIIELNHTKLTEALSKTVYNPSQSLHKIISANALLEHKSRLHMGGVITRLFNGYQGMYINSGSTSLPAYTHINIDDREYIVGREHMVENQKLQYPFNKVLSYPDYRASSIQLSATAEYNLSEALAINMAYYLTKSTPKRKYPDIITGSGKAATATISDVVKESNKMQVSVVNNPFAMDFATTYDIGYINTQIVAICAITDTQFASRYVPYSLYIFTSDGIFAPEDGSGATLYNRIIFVNHDIINNPRTIGTNNYVFYISERGIHAISSLESVVISTPININGRTIDFSEAALVYTHRWNELNVFCKDNRGNNLIYTYSLDNKMWSTRDLLPHAASYNILPKNTLSINSGSEYIIADTEHEDTLLPVNIKIHTREIMYNHHHTRLNHIIVFLQSLPSDISVTIQGSNNMVDWTTIRFANFCAAESELFIKRTLSSAKYYRILFESSSQYLSITHIDILLYIKYLNSI